MPSTARLARAARAARAAHWLAPALSRILGLLSVGLVLAGCAAPRAVLYTEETPDRRAAAHRALQVCERHAHQSIGIHAGAQVARRQAGTTGTIAAAGATAGALVKRSRDVVLTAVAAGVAGAVGAATRVALDWNRPDKAYEEHVDVCMKRRGYHVAGWR